MYVNFNESNLSFTKDDITEMETFLKKEKKDLQNKILKLETSKKKKMQKLETIKSLNNGLSSEQGKINGYDLNYKELLTFIPDNPETAIKRINNNLQNLKTKFEKGNDNTSNNNSKVKY